MFNKFSRTCALSDDLEKGNILNSPLFRFLSFAVCLSLMLGIFALIPFPVSAVTEGLVIDGKNCATINGYPIIGANHFNNKSLLAVRDFYNQCSIFLVCSYNGHYYLPVSAQVPQINIHGSNVEYIYFSGFGSEGDTTLQIYSSGHEKYYAWLEKICAQAVVSSDTVTVSFRSYSSTIKKLYDFNGNDVSDTINPFDCCYYWAVNPNFVWTSSSCYMKRSDIMSHSDGSGFISATTDNSSKAYFACFDNYEDYTLTEFSTNLSNGSYMTKRETLTTGHTRLSFLFDDMNTARSWQSVYNTPKMPLYTSKEISFNYYNGNTGGSSIYLKISKAQFMPNVREDDNLVSVGYFVMRPANTLIENYCQISGGSLNGCEPGRTYTYKINLQGFCDLNYNSFYCIEIYEVGNATPLTSCVYVYGGEDTLQLNTADKNKIEVFFDVSDGDNSSSIVLKPDKNGQMGVTDNMVSDDTFAYSSYNFNNMDVSQIFGTLQQSTANIGLFFNACYNIIPYSIIAIITAALTLLVILRILGR